MGKVGEMQLNKKKKVYFFRILFFDYAGELVLAHIGPGEVFKI